MKLNEIFGSHKDPFEDGYPDYFYPEKMVLNFRSETGYVNRNSSLEYNIVMTVEGEKEYIDEIMDDVWASIQSVMDWEIVSDDIEEAKDNQIYTYYVAGTPDFKKAETLFDTAFKNTSEEIARKNADKARRHM